MSIIGSLELLLKQDDDSQAQALELSRSMGLELAYMVAASGTSNLEVIFEALAVSDAIKPEAFVMISVPGKILVGAKLMARIGFQRDEVFEDIKLFWEERRLAEEECHASE